MTSACCCGTTRIALAMMMTATRNSASVTIQDPISIAASTVVYWLELLQSLRAAIRKDQHRAAHCCDVHGLGLWNTGLGKLRVPRASSVGDTGGSIGAPALDLDHLPDVEPLLRRRPVGQLALPSLEHDGPDHTERSGNQPLQRYAGIEPCSYAA